MSKSALDLAPTIALCYRGERRSKPEHVIYLLDQAMAKFGIDYFAAAGDFTDAPRFTVYVRIIDAEKARVAIEEIQTGNT